MRVMEIVRLASDKYAEGPTGKVVAVGGLRSSMVTVSWDGGKTTSHERDALTLVFSPFTRRQVSE